MHEASLVYFEFLQSFADKIENKSEAKWMTKAY